MKIYSCIELLILITLIIRLFYYLFSNKTILKSNLEVILYFCLLLLNNLSFLIFGYSRIISLAFLIILPLSIIVPKICKIFQLNILSTLLLLFLTTLLFYKTNQELVMYTLILCCITFLISTIIKLAKGSSHELKKSPIYIIITIDFLIITILQQLSSNKINWSNSHYFRYVMNIVLCIFLSNLILANVYIRRFFIN